MRANDGWATEFGLGRGNRAIFYVRLRRMPCNQCLHAVSNVGCGFPLHRAVSYVGCVGLARTIYIRCIYGVIGREITKYTVIYGAYIRFWPTLGMWLSLAFGQQPVVCPSLLCCHSWQVETNVQM